MTSKHLGPIVWEDDPSCTCETNPSIPGFKCETTSEGTRTCSKWKREFPSLDISYTIGNTTSEGVQICKASRWGLNSNGEAEVIAAMDGRCFNVDIDAYPLFFTTYF